MAVGNRGLLQVFENLWFPLQSLTALNFPINLERVKKDRH